MKAPIVLRRKFKSPPPIISKEDEGLHILEEKVQKVFKKIKKGKAAGPADIPSYSDEGISLVPQQGDVRLSGPPSGQGAGGEAQTRDSTSSDRCVHFAETTDDSTVVVGVS
ncbi:hypothetical protein PoB_006680300 [Plakobranchus ocellatus]|uniref:Uncharacterized protein n=1 Tax=Plakobranchus ocellatus TaxID=259542 RepID=A0AAV4D8B2_9GAST|nr:hypothetical protein PoB_006680300 [Plakobranchus ocellatus]